MNAEPAHDNRFASTFDREPAGSWAAPGRVNVIGEHTDYNDGFVLPIAIPHRVIATAARRGDDRIRIASAQEPDVTEVSLDSLVPGAVTGWAAYVAGVVWSLRAAGHPVRGLDLLVDGNVPQGAGLSSSAALECATALAATDLYEIDIDRPTLARIAQRAENDFVGMPCGVLDQSASLLCTQGNALFLDTRTLRTEQVPLDLGSAGLALLVIDTQAPHRHVDGEYASRRRTCEAAAQALGVTALRDIGMRDLDSALGQLDDPVMRQRVRHVVTENNRVLETIERLRGAGPLDVGDLLTQSHVSLRDDYEVTVPEIDTAFESALNAGALGARITGGGFGGCVIALVQASQTEAVESAVATAFAAEGFQRPVSFVAEAAPGAGRLP